MKRLSYMILSGILAASFLLSAGCAQEAPRELTLNFDFNSGEQGWEAGFCDLPVDFNPEIYDLRSGLAALPPELGQQGQGFMISGSNRSDDLFMFIKKKLGKGDGIIPRQTYEIEFTVEIASDAFAGGIGAGGAPGESVYVKVGAAGIEPMPVSKIQDGDPMLLLNIDKGTQSNEGPNAIVIGNVAKTDSSETSDFAFKTLTSAGRKFSMKSDEEGNLWLFVGTDSAYEGVTTLYYTLVRVTVRR